MVYHLHVNGSRNYATGHLTFQLSCGNPGLKEWTNLFKDNVSIYKSKT